MVIVSKGEDAKIDGFQRHAEEGKDPHGAGGQTGEEDGNQGKDAAEDDLPSHGDVFFLGLFEQHVPQGMQCRGAEQKEDGDEGHVNS